MNVFRDNRLFFFCFSLFAIVGAILLHEVPQGQEIIYFSERRSPFADWFFRWATRLGEEYIFLLAIAVYVILRKRTALFIALLGFTVTLVSYATKTFFAQDRPYAWFQKMGLLDKITAVEGVPMHSAATSFPSGHTMAAFALYSFLAFVIPRKQVLPAIFFVVALLTGVSRIYLAQHFLRDVYSGAVIGVALALGFYLWERRRGT
jgi:membrane-associated phospholipid phosphatase